MQWLAECFTGILDDLENSACWECMITQPFQWITLALTEKTWNVAFWVLALSHLANDLHSIMSNRKRENRARSLLRLFINGLYSLCPHFHAGSGCSACWHRFSISCFWAYIHAFSMPVSEMEKLDPPLHKWGFFELHQPSHKCTQNNSLKHAIIYPICLELNRKGNADVVYIC